LLAGAKRKGDNKVSSKVHAETKYGVAGTVGALIAIMGWNQLMAQAKPADPSNESQTQAEVKFYCNIKALTPAERVHHKQLTEKLMQTRTKVVEFEKGYELQFNPATVSIAELAEWASAESKCCPFFDFHIDLEEHGTLVCLRLTGAGGIKPFIRTEFQLPG
jgi:hypothetical protein